MPQTMSGPTLGLARFAVSSIPINQQTQVKLSDGMPVPVNTLTFDGKPVALAGSYPKNTPDALEAHMKMLLEKECSCLVVLTSEDQMQAKQLPPISEELHLWRGAYQQPKSELSQSGRCGRPIQYATVLRRKAVYNPGITCQKLARSPAVTVY